MSKGRVEAFSDGVFAVAITILVFNVKVPRVPAGYLWQALGAQWPSYAAYVASFLTIGIMWVNHHGMFERIARGPADADAQPAAAHGHRPGPVPHRDDGGLHSQGRR